MSTYVIFNVEPEESNMISQYLQNFQNIIGKFSGRNILNSGHSIAFNRSKNQSKFYILEFESLNKAKQFWDSDENIPLKQFRETSIDTKVSFIDGFSSHLIV